MIRVRRLRGWVALLAVTVLSTVGYPLMALTTYLGLESIQRRLVAAVRHCLDLLDPDDAFEPNQDSEQ